MLLLFGTRDQRAGLGCRRCLRPLRQSWAQGSAAMSRYLQTDASVAEVTVSLSAIYVPKHRMEVCRSYSGPIALLKDGDVITIDAARRLIEVEISDAEMEARRKVWVMPPYKATSGTLRKFIKNTTHASLGCTTDI
jgi:Dehydratase family